LKKKIYIWANDLSDFTGEGILANKFINIIKKNNYIHIISPLYNGEYNRKIINKKFNTSALPKLNNIFNKYFVQFIGIINLWFFFFKKEKIAYINYLPSWNFIIFALLPPKTFLGPITGTNDDPQHRSWTRRCLIPIFKKISFYIISKRQKSLLFSTDLQIKEFDIKSFDKILYNFVLIDFKIFRTKEKKRKFDLLVYYKKHNNKNNEFHAQLIKKLNLYNYKIAIIGDKIKINNVVNFGFVNRDIVLKILKNTKFIINSGENLYTLFALDAVKSGTYVFFNKKYKKNLSDLRSNLFIPLDFSNLDKSLNKILKFKKTKNSIIFKRRDFSSYFKQILY